MTVREFGTFIFQFLHAGVVYYAMQLVRCALLSYAVFALICLLRKTAGRNRIFLRGALWSLLFPVLFTGRMKFFYESRIGWNLFSWWTAVSVNRTWICWLYLAGVFVYAFLLSGKRRRLKKLTAGMEKRTVCQTPVYVTDMPVTPSAIGVFSPKIVMPGVILEEYDRKEVEMILLHEKVHIRLGHLLLYFLWDILRVLLWVNPLLTIGMKWFREDMEEISDRVTIQRSGKDAYAYGQLLLKSMRILQAEAGDLNRYAAFAGNKEYRNIRQRMAGIAGYRPYRRIAAAGVLAAAVLYMAGAVVWIRNVSYDRYNEDETVLVYGYDKGEVTFLDDSSTLQEMISYDDRYVYVDRAAFETYLDEKNAEGDIFILFGGFYKLPGFAGYRYSCFYEAGAEDAVVRISYEEQKDDWRLTLLKIL